jgi:hypothetical protein
MVAMTRFGFRALKMKKPLSFLHGSGFFSLMRPPVDAWTLESVRVRS